MDDDCDDFNTVEEKCESCVGGKYLSHGTCVDFTKYMDGDTETDIGITDCDQVQDQLVDGDLYCVSCSNDKIASNGACCDSGSTYDHADDVCLPNG
ncbi:MAG: hypothetical protein DHS20C13_26170 [Thermodesulfobacteriota bacterium]|nr:MAG: hypothetical protein DHS20C13_26170 [Thermodesulfobacteriota bacterium]